MASIQIDRSGSAPTIDLMVGNAEFGFFNIAIFDLDKREIRPIRRGDTLKRLPKDKPLATTAKDLIGDMLHWNVEITPIGGGSTSALIQILVKQDGVLCANGRMESHDLSFTGRRSFSAI